MAITKFQIKTSVFDYLQRLRIIEQFIDYQLCTKWPEVQGQRNPSLSISFQEIQKAFPYELSDMEVVNLIAIYAKKGWHVTLDEENAATLIFS